MIVHAPSSRRRKGTEHVLAACEGLDAELEIVEGLHHDEARERYRRADIVVDQLNAGWYGLFAIEAMALGKPVLTFLHDEAVARTEAALGLRVPIVNVTKETLRDRLAELVADPERRRRIGAESRAYVERVHDIERIADRLLELYAAAVGSPGVRAARTITVVGCHAGGEIGNVITGGVLPPAGATVFEQMQTLQREGDWLRRVLLREPRGSVACHANLVVPATRAGLRRGLHHHGADGVSGHVRLEHDLHGDGAARDRDGRRCASRRRS